MGGSLVGTGTNINHGEREIIAGVENTNQRHWGLSEFENLKYTYHFHEVSSLALNLVALSMTNVMILKYSFKLIV